MQFDCLDPERDGVIELAAPEPDSHLGHRQRRPQRIGQVSALHDLERFIGALERAVEHGQADVGRRQRRILAQRQQEFRLGLRVAALEHVQAVRAIASQQRRQVAEGQRLRVRLEKALIHRRGGRIPNVASVRYDSERPSNARRSDGDSSAACLKQSIARSKPARVRRLQKCHPFRTSSSDFGTSSRYPTFGRVVIQRPCSWQASLHFADRHVHRMARDDRAVPRLGNHLLVSNCPPAVPQQHAQRLERLRAQPDFGAIAQQTRRRCIQIERSEDDIGHRLRNLTGFGRPVKPTMAWIRPDLTLCARPTPIPTSRCRHALPS